MKNIWNTKIGPWILNHEACLYTCLGMVIVFGSLLFIQDIRHKISEKKILDEQIELIKYIEDSSSRNIIQGGVITSQNFIIEQRGATIQRASEIIKQQQEALQKLIEYLKDIDEWPPQFPENNPDNWT